MLFCRYGEDGKTSGTPEFTPPAPIRLQWDILPPCIAAIEMSYQVRRHTETLANITVNHHILNLLF
jgi:hypothetical protein